MAYINNCVKPPKENPEQRPELNNLHLPALQAEDPVRGDVVVLAEGVLADRRATPTSGNPGDWTRARNAGLPSPRLIVRTTSLARSKVAFRSSAFDGCRS